MHAQTLARVLAILVLSAAGLLAAPPPYAQAPATLPEIDPEINQAQRLVFMNDLMANVTAGSVLEYRFSRRGKGLPDYQDRVLLTVTRVGTDGGRDLQFDFLSGDEHLDFHPVTGYQGNPTPIHFLEHDIKAMSQATGTDINHLRNRIRKAFRHPTTEHTRIEVGGAALDATRITLTPFVDDPATSGLAKQAGKRYAFLFSEQVPGGLYRIEAQVPDETGVATVLEETLTFDHETLSR